MRTSKKKDNLQPLAEVELSGYNTRSYAKSEEVSLFDGSEKKYQMASLSTSRIHSLIALGSLGVTAWYSLSNFASFELLLASLLSLMLSLRSSLKTHNSLKSAGMIFVMTLIVVNTIFGSTPLPLIACNFISSLIVAYNTLTFNSLISKLALASFILTLVGFIAASFSSKELSPLNNLVANNNRPLTVVGKIGLSECHTNPPTVISNYKTSLSQESFVRKSCTFKINQAGGVHKIAIQALGKINVLDLSKYLLESDQESTLNLGKIPVLSANTKTLSGEIKVFDMMSEKTPIQDVKITLTSTSTGAIHIVTAENGSAKFSLPADYYTAKITSKTHMSVNIDASTLIAEPVTSVWLVSEKDAEGKSLLTVSSHSRNSAYIIHDKCGIMGISNCPMTLYKKFSYNGESALREYLLFDQDTPSPFRLERVPLDQQTLPQGRVLQEDSQPEHSEQSEVSLKESSEKINKDFEDALDEDGQELDDIEPVGEKGDLPPEVELSARTKECNLDWKTGKCQPIKFSKTISIKTRFNDLSVFAKDPHGYKPFPIKDSISGIKVRGEQNTIWYFLTYKDVEFIIVQGLLALPAQIYQPNGVVVDILSIRAKLLPQNAPVFATVTYGENQYFNIHGYLWFHLQQLPFSNYDGKFPKIRTHSANAKDLSGTLEDIQLTNLQIELEDDEAFDEIALFADNNSKQKTGTIYYSDKGYLTHSLESKRTYPGSSETYRVCIYCLKGVSFYHRYQYTYEGKEYSGKNLNFDHFYHHTENIDVLYDKLSHEVGHNIFIQQNLDKLNAENVAISSKDKDFEILNLENLQKILDLQLEKKLNNQWMSPIHDLSLINKFRTSPKIINKGQVYEFNTFLGTQFLDKSDSSFEPNLKDEIVPKPDTTDSGMDGLDFEINVLEDLFDKGKTVKGLFLKSTIKGVDIRWPYVLRIEDFIINQYYLNIPQLRVCLGISSNDKDPEFKPEDSCPDSKFLQSLKDKVVSDTTPVVDYLNNPHIVNYKDKNHTITDKCLDLFYDLDKKADSSAFTETEITTKKLENENQFYVKLDEKKFIFNFNTFIANTNNEVNPNVLKCLNQIVYENDPTEKRIIPINQKEQAVGYCKGLWNPVDKSCDGDFFDSTKQTKEDDEFVDDYTFSCTNGLTSKDGCAKQFNRTININDKTFNLGTQGPISFEKSVYNSEKVYLTSKKRPSFTEITCDSFNTEDLSCKRAQYEAYDQKEDQSNNYLKTSCEDTLYLKNMTCSSDSLTFHCQQDDLYDTERGVSCKGIFQWGDCQPATNVNGTSPELCSECPEGSKCDTKYCEHYFNGTECIKPVTKTYVLLDEKRYATGEYKGTYKPGVEIKGTTQVKQIKCEDEVSERNLCEEEPEKEYECEGTVNKEGCLGTVTSTVEIQDRLFNFTSSTTTSPVDLELASDNSLTNIFQENKTEEDPEISYNCSKSFNPTEKLCEDATFRKVSEEDNITTIVDVSCEGVFNLETEECENGEFEASKCVTRSPEDYPPKCNGDFSYVRCLDGGNAKECKKENALNENFSCENGIWNGKTCTKKPFHIIINNVAYITGKCDGEYVENESCEGTTEAEVILCPPDLTVNTLCDGPAVDTFTCVGKLTAQGCGGEYHGSILLQNSPINLDTLDGSFVSIDKTVSEGEAKLSLSEKNKNKGDWKEYSASCKNGFSNVEKTCSDATVKGALTQNDVTNYLTTSCLGHLDIDTQEWICEDGSLDYDSCATAETEENLEECHGLYTKAKCESGGSTTKCDSKGSDDVIKTCQGIYVYADEECLDKEYIDSEMALIQVNETHYLKGKCSSKVEKNQCKGTFDADFVSCPGRPTLRKEDFDACEKIEEENFGVCTGVTNATGCYGQYVQEFSVGDKGKIYMSFVEKSPENHYDFIEMHGNVNGKEDEETRKTKLIRVKCKDGFSPKTSECEDAVINLVYLEGTKGVAEGTQKSALTSCLGGNLNLNTVKCVPIEEEEQKSYTHSECTGHFAIAAPYTLNGTCIGTYEAIQCANGGQGFECSNGEEPVRKLSCENGFHNGVICSSDIETKTSKFNATRGKNLKVPAINGQVIEVCQFHFDSFSMDGAFVESIQTRDMTIPYTVFGKYTLKNNTLSDFREPLFSYNPTALEGGTVKQINFKDFTFDELDFRSLAVDDKCSLIKITFDKLTIKNTLFKNVVNRFSRFLKMETKDKTKSEVNFPFESFTMDMGFGQLSVEDVKVFLPYTKKSVYDKWVNEEVKDYKFDLPRVEDIEVPDFLVKFREDNGQMYLQYPQFSIEKKTNGQILMKDFLPSYDPITKLNANPFDGKDYKESKEAQELFESVRAKL